MIKNPSGCALLDLVYQISEILVTYDLLLCFVLERKMKYEKDHMGETPLILNLISFRLFRVDFGFHLKNPI